MGLHWKGQVKCKAQVAHQGTVFLSRTERPGLNSMSPFDLFLLTRSLFCSSGMVSHSQMRLALRHQFLTERLPLWHGRHLRVLHRAPPTAMASFSGITSSQSTHLSYSHSCQSQVQMKVQVQVKVQGAAAQFRSKQFSQSKSNSKSKQVS